MILILSFVHYVHRLTYGVQYLLTMGSRWVGGLNDASTTLLALPLSLSLLLEKSSTLQG